MSHCPSWSLFSHVQPLGCTFSDVPQIPSLGLLWDVRSYCSLPKAILAFAPAKLAWARFSSVQSHCSSRGPTSPSCPEGQVSSGALPVCSPPGHYYPTSLASIGVPFSLFPAPAQPPFSTSFLCQCSPTFLDLHAQAREAEGSASRGSDAVLPCLFLAHPCTDEACVGVKGSWKELRLSQPAVSACSDHTTSTLWLNSPVSTSFLLAQNKCRTVHVAAREESVFQVKNEAEEYGWEKYQKVISWSFPYFPFSPRFLRCAMSLPKGRSQDPNQSLLSWGHFLVWLLSMRPGDISVGCWLL